ncbi:MAG: hypothetical protein ACYS91_10865 [Planctomycetota bacterium]|jgi:alpha-tubulin suppressor-like RCC1 family protein
MATALPGWGKNDYGQSAPPTGNDFVAVSTIYGHSLALRLDGSIVGWGDDNRGQATPPPDNNDFVAIAAGQYHSLGLKSDWSIVSWGDYTGTPPAGNDYVAIAAGGRHNGTFSVRLRRRRAMILWPSRQASITASV